MWGFQALLIPTALIPNISPPDSHRVDSRQYVVATIAAVITSVALAAHWKVQPYAHPVLNKLQSFMYACIIATLLLVIPYSKAIDGYQAGNNTEGAICTAPEKWCWCGAAPEDSGVCVYGWIVLTVLVSSIVGVVVVLIWKWVDFRRRATAFNAHQLDLQQSDDQHYHLMDDDMGETAVDSKGSERGNNELAVFSDSSDRDLLAMGESAGTTEDGGRGTRGT